MHSPEELNVLGLAHHRGHKVACPTCGSLLVVSNRAHLGQVSQPLSFNCPHCGYLGEFEPPDLRSSWGDAIVAELVADHLRHGQARCPLDQGILGVTYLSNPAGEYVHLACPSCGRLYEGSPPA
jgi:predicted RNA-binding Zn-ribbon protein involved in translation (DUF1610 family)